MPFIKTVAAANLKRRTFQYELAPLTLITGPNRAGKTAIFDAIRLALVHYTEKTGKTNAGIWDLWGGNLPELNAGVVLDDGTEFTAQWLKKRDSVSASFQAPLSVPPVLMAVSDFMDRSASERAAFLAGLVDMSSLGVTESTLRAMVRDLKPTDMTPEASDVVDLLLNDVAGYGEAMEAGVPLADWLRGILDGWRANLKSAKDVAKRMSATVQAQAQLESKEGQSPARPTAPADLAEANQEMGDLRQELGLVQEKERAGQAGLQRKIGLQTALAARIDKSQDIAKLEAERKQLADLVAGYQPSADQARDRYTLANRAVEDAWADLARAREEVARLEYEPLADQSAELADLDAKAKAIAAELDGTKPDLVALNKSEAAIEASLAEAGRKVGALSMTLSNLERERAETDCPTCPKCQTKSKKWAAMVFTELTRIFHETEATKAEFDKWHAEHDRLKATAGQWVKKLVEAEEALKVWEWKHGQATAMNDRATLLRFRQTKLEERRARLAVLAKFQEETKAKLADAEPIAAKLATEYQQANAADTEWFKRRERIAELSLDLAKAHGYQAETFRLQDELGQLEAAAPVNVQLLQESAKAITQRVTVLQTRLETLAAEVRRLHMDQQDGVRVEQAKQEAQATKAEVELYGLAVAAFEAERERLTGLAFGRILNDANILAEALEWPAIQFRDGEFGWIDNGLFIKPQTMSGAEEAFLYSALCVALAQGSPVRVLMLDEFSRFLPPLKRRILTGLGRLLKTGRLDQAIIIDPDPGWARWAQSELTSALTVIELQSAHTGAV